MKNLSVFVIAFLGLTLSMTSCTKEESIDKQMEELEVDPTPTDEWFFSFEINGTTHMCEGLMAYGIDDVDSEVVRAYGVFPNFEDGMYVEIPKGPGSGTYAITDEVFSIFTDESGDYGTYFGNENVGEVTLNFESEKVLSGEFAFRIYNSDKPEEYLEVTNGKFRVAYRD